MITRVAESRAQVEGPLQLLLARETDFGRELAAFGLAEAGADACAGTTLATARRIICARPCMFSTEHH
jgi:hypothetical protein